MVVIPDVTKRAGEETRARFEEMVAGAGVTEEERLANKEKTNRHLRLAELLQSHSSQAEIIFMTLPMPRRGEQNVITVRSGVTSGKKLIIPRPVKQVLKKLRPNIRTLRCRARVGGFVPGLAGRDDPAVAALPPHPRQPDLRPHLLQLVRPTNHLFCGCN